jgi:hypothetical protein
VREIHGNGENDQTMTSSVDLENLLIGVSFYSRLHFHYPQKRLLFHSSGLPAVQTTSSDLAAIAPNGQTIPVTVSASFREKINCVSAMPDLAYFAEGVQVIGFDLAAIAPNGQHQTP